MESDKIKQQNKKRKDIMNKIKTCLIENDNMKSISILCKQAKVEKKDYIEAIKISEKGKHL